jgi:hypothetical protein
MLREYGGTIPDAQLLDEIGLAIRDPPARLGPMGLNR